MTFAVLHCFLVTPLSLPHNLIVLSRMPPCFDFLVPPPRVTFVLHWFLKILSIRLSQCFRPLIPSAVTLP